MKIERKFTESKDYGDKRNKRDIEYIVIQTIDNKPITHYQVRDDNAIQYIPDEFLSNSVNGARLSTKGVFHGICTKYNSISIGLPSKPSTDEIQTCIKLIMTIKQRYKVKNEKVIRLTDITGEPNPERWYDNERWHKDIISNLIEL